MYRWSGYRAAGAAAAAAAAQYPNYPVKLAESSSNGGEEGYQRVPRPPGRSLLVKTINFATGPSMFRA